MPGENLFDRKFGENFIGSVPLCAGVYEFLDADGQVIYVGKAKILRRRLQQYRNARRCKKQEKMRAILRIACSIRLNTCENEFEALLLENKFIQNLRPRFNIVGAFSFLYPVIAIRRSELDLIVTYTTSPAEFQSFELFGAYRSRWTTRGAYRALVEILGYLGHREPHRRLKEFSKLRFSRIAGYRQVSDETVVLLRRFLRGETAEFLQYAVEKLVESAVARQRASEVQEQIDELLEFFKFEAKKLRKVLKASGSTASYLAQEERDPLFLKARHKKLTASEQAADDPS
jgi:excinuclease ABC subunit C